MNVSPKILLAYLLPILIIVGMGYYFVRVRPNAEAVVTPAGKSGDLKDGKSYYVFVRSLEVAAKKPSGKTWDRVSDKAPDPYYEIHWQGVRVFKSQIHRDQLICSWQPLGVDTTVKSIMDGRIAVDSVIKAATIRADKGEMFELRVFDSDPVSKDTVAKLTFSLDELAEGDNHFTYDATSINSVTRLRLAVVNADQPLMTQIEHILTPQ